MHKRLLQTASLLGALAVGLGAFGAHALKSIVSEKALSTFETGVKYQFYHVLALALVGILHKEFPNKWLLRAGNLFVIGIILFSGSLYVLTFLTSMQQPNFKWIGIVTPFGGLAFIAGWLCLFIALRKTSHNSSPA